MSGVRLAEFFTAANLSSLLNTNSVNLIFAVGLLVVLIAGGIDISFAVARLGRAICHRAARLPQSAAATGSSVSLFAGAFGVALGCINAA